MTFDNMFAITKNIFKMYWKKYIFARNKTKNLLYIFVFYFVY